MPPVERRRGTRVECCYPVIFRQDGQEFAATVVEMGLGGMRLLASHRLRPATCLEVRQPGVELVPVEVRVTWSRRRGGSESVETGLVYLGPVERLERSWVKPALSRLGFEGGPIYERRKHVRVPLDVSARMRLGQEWFPCRLLDLGMGGALVECEQRAQEGQALQLEVEVGGCDPLPARVVYVREGKAWRHGVAFDADRMTQGAARLVEGYLQAMA